MVSFSNTEIAFASKNNRQLKKAHFLFKIMGNPSLVGIGSRVTNLALKLRLPVKSLIKNTIFQQFCGGESIPQCAITTQVLDKYGIGTILDYSVEGKHSPADFDATEKEIIRTITTGNGNEHIPFCVFKLTGIARFPLLAKLNNLGELSPREREEAKILHDRVYRICKAAFDANTPIFIDAEESWIQDTIDRIATTMMQQFNKQGAIVYNTVQLYRHDRLAFLKDAHQKAKDGGYILGIKLVRGAYMEKERERAHSRGYSSPIQPNKEAADIDFNDALRYCVEHIDDISFCAGSHNEESNLLLTELMQQKGLSNNDKRIYYAQLFGMSDHISFNLASESFNVAKYVPYGPVEEVIPYLMRRAEENTSVAGQTSRELRLIQTELKRRRA